MDWSYENREKNEEWWRDQNYYEENIELNQVTGERFKGSSRKKINTLQNGKKYKNIKSKIKLSN